jgi:predicted CxxxxCH...CXXCH cytochrome family protein
MTCDACHPFPADDPASHIDFPPAEVRFAGTAVTGGLRPKWNGTICSGTYCHGATLSGGKAKNPVWTRVDGSQAVCGSCHGAPPPLPHPQTSDCTACHLGAPDPALHINGRVDVDPDLPCDSCHGAPPPLPHPQRANCSLCHSAVVDAGGEISNPALHRNGTVNVDNPLPCNGCHGDDALDPIFEGTAAAAPPKDVAGNASTSFLGIGAHRAHLGPSSLTAAPVPCTECHPVPHLWNDGHIDGLPAEIRFGDFTRRIHLAYRGTSAPKPDTAWDRESASCSNAYCHKPNVKTDTAARHQSPVWTRVDGSQKQCDSCHGYPPSFTEGGHVHTTGSPYNDPPCGGCHSLVVSNDPVPRIICRSWHMDGQVNFGAEGPCPVP